MNHSYSPADSLAYLARAGLLDVAAQALTEVEERPGDKKLLDTASSAVDTMRRVIAYEARNHGLDTKTHYTTNVPIEVADQEHYGDEDDDGLCRICSREVIRTMHPTAVAVHPVAGGSA